MRAAIILLVVAIAVPARAGKLKASVAPRPQPTEPPLDADEAARQIRARLGLVRACYERAVRREPDIHGKLQLGLDISDAGQVTAVDVELDGLRAPVSRAAADELTGCVRAQALGWRLASAGPSGGIHLSYVFLFAGHD